MNNEEIRLRMRNMGFAVANKADQLINGLAPPVPRELELANMSLMQIAWILGEIAMRLPEPKESHDQIP